MPNSSRPLLNPPSGVLKDSMRVAGIDGRHFRRAGVLSELDQRNVARGDQRRIAPLREVDRAEAIVVEPLLDASIGSPFSVAAVSPNRKCSLPSCS